jgi:hypothetical protein
MIQITASPMPGLIDSPRPPGVSLTMTSDFALALADQAVGMVAPTPQLPPGITPEAVPAIVIELRQPAAAAGKPLPATIERPIAADEVPASPSRAARVPPLSGNAALPPATSEADPPDIERAVPAGAPEQTPAIAVLEALPVQIPVVQPAIDTLLVAAAPPPAGQADALVSCPTPVLSDGEGEPSEARQIGSCVDSLTRRSAVRQPVHGVSFAPIAAPPNPARMPVGPNAQAESLPNVAQVGRSPASEKPIRAASPAIAAPGSAADIAQPSSPAPGSMTAPLMPGTTAAPTVVASLVRSGRVAIVVPSPAALMERTPVVTASRDLPPLLPTTPIGAPQTATQPANATTAPARPVTLAIEQRAIDELPTEPALPACPTSTHAGSEAKPLEVVRAVEQPAARRDLPAGRLPNTPANDPLPRPLAAQAFARAMFAAERAPTPLLDPLADIASTFQINPLAAPGPAVVHAVVDARAPVLDLRGTAWMGEMIETIEQLRDAAGPAFAGATETRLRLAPDSLGSIDVAIRQEGEQLSVRITAETQIARTILAEAAPKLAEMAEARGLKLGQPGAEHVGGGNLADRQPRQQQPSNQAARPAPINAADDAPASPALTRIA